MAVNETSQEADTLEAPRQPSSSDGARKQHWFSVPEPVKRIFDKFPLITYPSNELPGRSSKLGRDHVLYVFTTRTGAREQEPSFNPSCLKWQVYLKVAGVRFSTKPSNNHASPSGALPFLLSSSISRSDQCLAIAAGKLQNWVKEQVNVQTEPKNMRYDAYLSLLDYRIRHAWLYSLYLVEPNFNNVAYHLYIAPTSSNPLVRTMLAYQLQQAAKDELQKHSTVIDGDDLLVEANLAFEALSNILGEDKFFFAAMKPSLFDASVFSYTHLLLDERLGWKDKQLVRLLKKNENLVDHRNRILHEYF